MCDEHLVKMSRTKIIYLILKKLIQQTNKKGSQTPRVEATHAKCGLTRTSYVNNIYLYCTCINLPKH